jgi:hypothetical protein
MSLKDGALKEVAQMEVEAEEIRAVLATLREGIEDGDAVAIRKGLAELREQTYGYASGIVGFKPCLDSIDELKEELEVEPDGAILQPSQ